MHSPREGVTCALTLKSCLASSPEAELWLPCPSNSTPGCALRDAAASRQWAQAGNSPNVRQQERGLARGGVPVQQNSYNDGGENCHNVHTWVNGQAPRSTAHSAPLTCRPACPPPGRREGEAHGALWVSCLLIGRWLHGELSTLYIYDMGTFQPRSYTGITKVY